MHKLAGQGRLRPLTRLFCEEFVLYLRKWKRQGRCRLIGMDRFFVNHIMKRKLGTQTSAARNFTLLSIYEFTYGFLHRCAPGFESIKHSDL